MVKFDEKIFIEQAEYIDKKDLNIWHIEHPNEKMIMRKLCQGGAKLLSGPRGCGKTTLMLRAHNEMCKKKHDVFSVYVNFKVSLKLEPLYRQNINGSYWFNQWLLLKVYKGIYSGLADRNISNNITLSLTEKEIDNYLNKIELGYISELKNSDDMLTISMLEGEIEKILDIINASYCVLLLDDAAHAFSKEQQYDFFEFFRNIKSREISPKAAIYPGVTNFSASFHIGHDAEEINVWLKPMEEDYLSFMDKLVYKRLPEDIYNTLNKEKDIFELICYASFGIPRALLNIIGKLCKETDDSEKVQIELSKKSIMTAINQVNDSTYSIYKSLEYKLPIYKKFINKGDELFTKIVDAIKTYNKDKLINNQTVNFAIRQPIPMELTKVFNFFQYSGLIMYQKELSKGEKGIFSIYTIHYGTLIEKNVFLGRTNIKTSSIVTALKQRDAHAYKRFTVESLLETNDIKTVFPLSLPPCPKCNTPRLSADTKFCSQCGNQLVTLSIFDELVNNDISKLPLTQYRVNSIKNNSNIKTIRDILIDTEHKQLRSVPGIGPYWVDKIYSYAEEYIG